jgi:hypothetical protein
VCTVLLRKHTRKCVLSYYGLITYSIRLGLDWLLVATDTPRKPEVWSKSFGSSVGVGTLLHPLRLLGVHFRYYPEFLPHSVQLSNGPEFPCCSSCLFMCRFYVFNDVVPTAIFILSRCLADDLIDWVKVNAWGNFWLFNDIISTKYLIQLNAFTTLLNTR